MWLEGASPCDLPNAYLLTSGSRTPLFSHQWVVWTIVQHNILYMKHDVVTSSGGRLIQKHRTQFLPIISWELNTDSSRDLSKLQIQDAWMAIGTRWHFESNSQSLVGLKSNGVRTDNLYGFFSFFLRECHFEQRFDGAHEARVDLLSRGNLGHEGFVFYFLKKFLPKLERQYLIKQIIRWKKD